MKTTRILIILFLTWTAFCPAQIPQNGLVAYFPFNGNANDESGLNNNGTVSDAVLAVDRFGKENGCYQFRGMDYNDFIKVNSSSSLDFSGKATYSFYVKLQEEAGMDGYGKKNFVGVHTLFAKDHDRSGYAAVFNSDDNGSSIWMASYGGVKGGTDAKISRMLGQWKHVVLTFNDGTSKLYVNGNLVHQQDTGNINIGNGKDLYFGRFNGSWYPLNGFLDDFRIYNRELSAKEILGLFKSEGKIKIPPIAVKGKTATAAKGTSKTSLASKGKTTSAIGKKTETYTGPPVKVMEEQIYFAKGDGANLGQFLNSSDKGYQYQNVNVFVIGKVKNFTKTTRKVKVKVTYYVDATGRALFSSQTTTRDYPTNFFAELGPNEEKLFATYLKLKRESQSYGIGSTSVDLNAEKPYKIEIEPFTDNISSETIANQNAVIEHLRTNGNIPIVKGFDTYVEGFKKDQQEKCSKCVVDWTKTQPVKNYTNWLGNLDSKDGIIQMKNGTKFNFNISKKGEFYIPEFGYRNKFSSFDDMIKLFITKCEEKYCGFK